MSLLVYIDTETTGRYTETCGATQISGIIVRDGKEVSTIDLDINPFTYNRDITVSDKALEVTSKTLKEIKGYPPVSISYLQFTMWLNKHRREGEYYTLIAYRTPYDIGVLESLFKDQSGDKRTLYNYIHYKTIDVLEIVKVMTLWGIHKSKNEKLVTICEYYGIELNAHDSMEDIKATRLLHKRLMKELKLPLSKINKV